MCTLRGALDNAEIIFSFAQEEWDMHVTLFTDALKITVNFVEKLFPYKYNN
jgi:hypothetical protein